ncbi:hypothetical protein EV401DRAFT_1895571 [Pisolithus croceorrhizus]|nr:hypothetical protein EV401DRAFT_1895571 [Pisolithus croceorrhizus]
MYFHGTDILMFGMYDGEIKDGVILATKTIRRLMQVQEYFRGNAAIDSAHMSFVINNAVNGFSLHRMEDGICTRTYDTNPKKGFPKQVTIAERESVVIGRGDDRLVYVFDKGTSELVQTLWQSTNGQVQTVTQQKQYLNIYMEKTGDIFQASSQKKGGPTALSICQLVLQMIPHLMVLAAIMMFTLQMSVGSEVYTSMQGKGHLVNPLSWKRNPMPAFLVWSRGIAYVDKIQQTSTACPNSKFHGESTVDKRNTGYGDVHAGYNIEEGCAGCGDGDDMGEYEPK